MIFAVQFPSGRMNSLVSLI